jgi:hypothetical protein
VYFRNYRKLTNLRKAILHSGRKPYYFQPSEIETSALSASYDLIEFHINTKEAGLLRHNIAKKLLQIVKVELNAILKDFKEIQKSEDFQDLKRYFKENERQLSKDQNLPEDEDFRIMAGFCVFDCKGIKVLISEDEHFWAYEDILKEKCDIRVVKEWECSSLLSNISL